MEQIVFKIRMGECQFRYKNRSVHLRLFLHLSVPYHRSHIDPKLQSECYSEEETKRQANAENRAPSLLHLYCFMHIAQCAQLTYATIY